MRTPSTRRRGPGRLGIAIVVLIATACSPSASPSSAPTIAPTSSPTPSTAPLASPSVPVRTPSVSASFDASAPFDPTGINLDVRVVVDGLAAPVDVTSAGDGSGRLFVVEQGGRIRIVKDGVLVARPFLDISDRITSGGERGLLGLAFHPDFPADPRFFVNYTDLDGNTVIAQFKVDGSDPDVADPKSELVILGFKQPYPNHNGGAVEFGPDGMLYVSTGDGGSAGDPQGNGQRLDTFLAKILRFDIGGNSAAVPYKVPPDNPFITVAGAKPEIWLTGLRNPWRIRFDRATGDLWIGDVGQNAWEEIDVARAGVGGLNYGWNTMEGFHCYSPASGCDQDGLTLPLAEYGHDLGCAVIGGVVVRDPRQPVLDGGYIFGDECSGNLWVMDPTGTGKREPVLASKTGTALSAIGEDEDGNVFATDVSGGTLMQITAAAG
jgi:glucose/arabinose dehydrogenase